MRLDFDTAFSHQNFSFENYAPVQGYLEQELQTLISRHVASFVTS